MAAPAKINELREADLQIPEGDLNGAGLREVFRRLYFQLNPFFDALNKLTSKGITATDNMRAEIVTATFSHGVATPLKLKTLTRPASALVLSWNTQPPISTPLVQMSNDGTQAVVTVWFFNSSAANVKLTLLLLEDGVRSTAAAVDLGSLFAASAGKNSETPTPAPDGSNAVFSIAATPTPPESLQLYLDGVLQFQGVHYTLAGTTITFLAGNIPQVGQNLRAYYPLNASAILGPPGPPGPPGTGGGGSGFSASRFSGLLWADDTANKHSTAGFHATPLLTAAVVVAGVGGNSAQFACQTGNVAGQTGGVIGPFTTCNIGNGTGNGPKLTARILVTSNAGDGGVNQRRWVGISDGDLGGLIPTLGSAAQARKYVAFVVDKAVSANWILMSGDGTNHSGIDTGVAVPWVDTGTGYILGLDWTNNGTLVATVQKVGGSVTSLSKTSNLASTLTTLVGPWVGGVNKAAIAHNYWISRITMEGEADNR